MTSKTDPPEDERPGSAIHSDGSPNIAKEPPTTYATSSLQGWHEYPLNLPIYNGFSQNMSLYSSRLTTEAGRLFCASNEATMEIWDISQPSDTDPIKRSADEDTLEKMLTDNKGTHFRAFIIKPWHSWDRLLITEEMLRKLFTFHQVFPDFLGIVHCFGKRNREKFSYSAGFRHKIKLKSSNISMSHSELCFGLFHVERHGRDFLPDPWSIRQMGFYLEFNFERQSSVHIYIQPSTSVKKLLHEAIRHGYFKTPHPMSLHLAFLAAAMENWVDYINYLEEELMDLRKCVLLSDDQWNNLRRYGDIKINYSDYFQLQRTFRDKALRVFAVLDSNLDVVLGLQRYNTQMRKLRLIPHDTTFLETSQILEYHNLEIRGLRKNLRSILQIVEGSVKLVQTLLDIRNDATIRGYSDATHGLLDAAKCSREEALVMVELAQRTKRDSRAMRIATIVAMLYLPGTFVATMFGMNLIVRVDVQTENGTVSRMVFVKEIWWFVLSTVLLMGVTMGSWWFSERNLRLQDSRRKAANAPPPNTTTADVSPSAPVP